LIDKITIATGETEKMAAFYAAVFGAELREVPAYGTGIWVGKLGSLEVMLCPKVVAGITAKENTIQLRFVVPDVQAAMTKAGEHGGMALGEPFPHAGRVMGAIRDPDGNSIELISA
jgi:predicted enzyme related to lactoylglutathione lyase